MNEIFQTSLNQAKILEAIDVKITPVLSLRNFRFNKNKFKYIQKTKFGRFHLFFSISSTGGDYAIKVVLGVRFDNVAELYNKLSGLDPSGHKDSVTYAESLYFLLHKDDLDYNPNHYYSIRNEKELESFLDYLQGFLSNNFDELYTKLTNYDYIESLYNDENNLSFMRGKFLLNRILNGLIMAKILKRSYFEELVIRYDQFLRANFATNMQVKRFYPKEYNIWVAFLRDDKKIIE
jgi:hypothetical protein